MENACDIGDKLHESIQTYQYFDFKLIEDVPAWYIHHVLEDDYK